jgi:hypothetical protein
MIYKNREFNQLVREATAVDFHPRNAWQLTKEENGKLVWVGDDKVLDKQPANSSLQRLEDWFLSVLPIEGEM